MLLPLALNILRIGLCFILLATLFTPAAQAKPDPAPRIGKIRWGYYVAYDANSFTSLKQHIGDLDYISPWWYKMDGQGNLLPQSGDKQVDDPNRDEVISLARSRGVKILPMVQNREKYSAFHAVLANPAVRARAITNLVDLVTSSNFDGIHIDFEGLNSADRQNLTTFMAELAAAMHPKGKLVTQALAAKDKERDSGWAGPFDYASLAIHNDLLVLMSYGFRTSNSTTPGSTAPITWVEGTVEYAASQIPTSKLILGLPWYGYDWNKTTGPPAKPLRYDETIALVQQFGASIQYDSARESPYFNYVSQGQAHEVWFENRRSQDAKLDLVFKYSLAGIAGWRMGHEDPATWESLRARLAFRTWYLAEGSTSPPYHTWILLMNPNSQPAQATVTLMKEDGRTLVKQYRLLPNSRFSLFVNQILPNAAFSTRVDSDLPIFVERAMYFGHDGHVSPGVNAASRKWYLPEGNAGPGVDTWILLMNPGESRTAVTVTFMRENGTTVVKRFELRPTSRLNIWADQHVPNTAFATVVESELPIVVERAMYFPGGGGHGSVGIPYSAKTWYFAEGYSGFGTWFLLLNPNPTPVEAAVTFMKEDGTTIRRSYTLKATSRLNIYANSIVTNAAFSTKIEADKPIVAERSMYWEGSDSGHSSMGASSPAYTWFLPEGSTAYPFDEWVLITNPGDKTATVTANFLTEGGSIVTRQYQVGPNSRFTIHLDEIVSDKAVSTRLDSDQPIVAERSMYFGRGGHNSMGISQ